MSKAKYIRTPSGIIRYDNNFDDDQQYIVDELAIIGIRGEAENTDSIDTVDKYHHKYFTITKKCIGLELVENKEDKDRNVATARTLVTARDIKIGLISKSFDGSKDISYTLDEIGALPTAGGTMTGTIVTSNADFNSLALQGNNSTDMTGIIISQYCTGLNISIPSGVDYYSNIGIYLYTRNYTYGIRIDADSVASTPILINRGSTELSSISINNTNAKGGIYLQTSGEISSNNNYVVTGGAVYSKLPKINGSQTYTSSNSIYAPTEVGSKYQVIQSNGSGAPSWVTSPTINGTITFIASNQNGIRTNTHNYCTIGTSDAYFCQSYVSSMYSYYIRTAYLYVYSNTDRTSDYKGAVICNTLTEDRIYRLPDANGTILLSSTLKLNGDNKTNPSFYAPVTSGSDGQILKSQGPNVTPIWATFRVNGSVISTYNDIYAPTSWGSYGTILAGSGCNGAPDWVTIKVNNSYLTDQQVFYAPVSYGDVGQLLVCQGDTEPYWTGSPTITAPYVTDTLTLQSGSTLKILSKKIWCGSYSPSAGEENIYVDIDYARIRGMYTNIVDISTTDSDNYPNTRIRLWATNDGYGVLCPPNDGKCLLGCSAKRFSSIYSTSSAISTSDRTKKHDIKLVDEDTAISLVNLIEAVTYKLNESESNRTHYGMISQQVEEVLNQLNIDSQDFAAFIKSPKCKEVINKENNTKELQEIEGEYDYSLRYEEFIPILWKVCQYLLNKNTELKDLTEKVKDLENRLSEYEEKQ